MINQSDGTSWMAFYSQELRLSEGRMKCSDFELQQFNTKSSQVLTVITVCIGLTLMRMALELALNNPVCATNQDSSARNCSIGTAISIRYQVGLFMSIYGLFTNPHGTPQLTVNPKREEPSFLGVGCADIVLRCAMNHFDLSIFQVRKHCLQIC